MVTARADAIAAIAVFSVALLVSGSAAFADSTGSPMGGLRPGLYQMRDLETKQSSRICLKSRTDLVQLRHPGQACEQFVVRSEAKALKLHYTCPGNGWGQTEVRVETSGLALIDSQGIAAGRPFSLSAELRYQGAC